MRMHEKHENINEESINLIDSFFHLTCKMKKRKNLMNKIICC